MINFTILNFVINTISGTILMIGIANVISHKPKMVKKELNSEYIEQYPDSFER